MAIKLLVGGPLAHAHGKCTINLCQSPPLLWSHFHKKLLVQQYKRIVEIPLSSSANLRLCTRVFHFYTFFELSLVLLTTQAHGL